MRTLSIVANATYLQILTAIRVRVAIFFALVFPTFLFILFGNIWGTGADYYPFLLTGVIGITMASDGLFSIGNVVKSYFDHNLIKFFRNLPFNILLHFLGLFFAKAIILFLAVTILSVCAYLFFDHVTTLEEYFRYLSAVIIGLTMFAFLGLVLAFITKTSRDQMAVANVVYFLMMFTTDAFYNISSMNGFFKTLAAIQPMTYILSYLRGDYTMILPVLIWTVVFGGLFYVLFTKKSVNRS